MGNQANSRIVGTPEGIRAANRFNCRNIELGLEKGDAYKASLDGLVEASWLRPEGLKPRLQWAVANAALKGRSSTGLPGDYGAAVVATPAGNLTSNVNFRVSKCVSANSTFRNTSETLRLRSGRAIGHPTCQGRAMLASVSGTFLPLL